MKNSVLLFSAILLLTIASCKKHKNDCPGCDKPAQPQQQPAVDTVIINNYIDIYDTVNVVNNNTTVVTVTTTGDTTITTTTTGTNTGGGGTTTGGKVYVTNITVPNVSAGNLVVGSYRWATTSIPSGCETSNEIDANPTLVKIGVANGRYTYELASPLITYQSLKGYTAYIHSHEDGGDGIKTDISGAFLTGATFVVYDLPF